MWHLAKNISKCEFEIAMSTKLEDLVSINKVSFNETSRWCFPRRLEHVISETIKKRKNINVSLSLNPLKLNNYIETWPFYKITAISFLEHTSILQFEKKISMEWLKNYHYIEREQKIQGEIQLLQSLFLLIW